MKSYESYRPSGTAWLGCVPAAWDVQKIGALFAQRKVKVSDTDYAPLSVSKGGIVPQLSTAAKTDDGDNRKLVRTGDFVINSRSDRKGSCGVSPLDGSVSLINIVLKPRQEWNSRYVHYLLRSQPFSEEYYRNGRGIVADLWTTRYSEMKSILLPVPPRAEQDQIVRYLDWQVSKINRLIAAKKHQISVLRERETKLISSTICGMEEAPNSLEGALSSINPNCIVANLSQLLNGIEQGWSPNAGKETNSSEQWHVLTLSAIKHGAFHAESNKPIDVAASVPQQLALRNGDLLMTRSNTRNLVGDVCIVDKIDGKTIFSDLIYRLLINDNMAVPKYIMYYLMSSLARHQIERAAKGSSGTMPKLSHTDIKKIRVILPSLESQEEIVSRIDAITKSTELIISGITCSLTKLVEYRTRLISDVVTGQIDVRGIEIPDFEMAEETNTDETDDGNEFAEETDEQEDV